MRHKFATLVVVCTLLMLIALLLPACDASSSSSAAFSYALSRCNGQTVPLVSTASRPPVAPPTLYVGSVGANLYAFNAISGMQRWCNRLTNTVRYTCDGHCPPPPITVANKPLLAANVLYVCVSGVTYAFNASDGALRWQRETDCGYQAIPFEYSGQPILAQGLLYTGTYVLAASDGTVRWRAPQQNGAFVAVVAGVAYTAYDSIIYAFTATTGAPLWNYLLDDPISVAPFVTAGIVIVSEYVPMVYALDAKTGAVLWQHLSSNDISSIAADAATDLAYIVEKNGNVYALNLKTGILRWQRQIGSYGTKTPLSVHGVLYLITNQAYAINAVNGSVRWHTSVNPGTFTTMAVLNDMLYVGAEGDAGDSVVYALSINTGSVLWQTENINQVSPPVAG